MHPLHATPKAFYAQQSCIAAIVGREPRVGRVGAPALRNQTLASSSDACHASAHFEGKARCIGRRMLPIIVLQLYGRMLTPPCYLCCEQYLVVWLCRGRLGQTGRPRLSRGSGCWSTAQRPAALRG